MFANLDNHKILKWVLFRIKKSKLINKFIVATSKNNEKSLIKIAEKSGYKFLLAKKTMFLKDTTNVPKKINLKTLLEYVQIIPS